jgi:hypothetical protein
MNPPYAHPDAHRFRIGLAPINAADWFEGPLIDGPTSDGPTSDGPASARKAQVFAQSPALCWGALDRSLAAQIEALAMVRAYFGLGARSQNEPDPLRQAAMLVDDDLCLMEKCDGRWTLTAASLCAPSYFSAARAVGKALEDLHQPVTGFGDNLLARVVRIFDRLDTTQILERRNWSVVSSGALFLPESEPIRAREPYLEPARAGQDLFLRMERQTIRRLPQSGAVLFTIRVHRHPLDHLRRDPDRLSAFAAAWQKVMSDAGRDFRDYKCLGPLDRLVAAFLADAGEQPDHAS